MERSRDCAGHHADGALFTEENWYCVHVGDSRLYEIAADTARQLTRDHSLAAEAVEQGFMTREEGEKDKRRSVLTRCIGACPETVAEYQRACSDRTPCTFCARTASGTAMRRNVWQRPFLRII